MTALLGTVIVIMPPAPTAAGVLGTAVETPLVLVPETPDKGMTATVALVEDAISVDGDIAVPVAEAEAEEEGITTTVVP